MNRWLIRLLMGLLFGLAGLYFQYNAMTEPPTSATASDGDDGASAPDTAASPAAVAPGALPAELMKAIEKGQSGGARRGRSRSAGR